MARMPAYINNKEIPDGQLLKTIKDLMKDGKSTRKIKSELPNVSMYKISRYYTKIQRGLW